MGKELRDLFANKEELQAKRKKLKEQALEHRDIEGMTEAKEQIREIDEQIKTIDTEIKKIQEERGDQNKMNEQLLNFDPEKMERCELIASPQYRTAFMKQLQGKDLTAEELRTITTGSSSAGAAIPTTTMNMIIGEIKESKTALGLVTILNIPNLVSLPKENVTNDADWVAEGADGTAKDDTLTKISFAVNKLLKLVKISAEVKAMAIDAFEAWIVRTIVRKMEKALDKAIFAGTGSGQPKGLEGEVWDESNSVTSAAITYDNLCDLEGLVDEDYINEAVFVMNRKTLASVKKLQGTDKKPIFERIVEDGFRGYLLGIPVRLDRNAGDGNIYLGDWAAAYVYNFTKDIEISKSGEAGFMSGDTVYRGLALVDGKPTGVKGSMVRLKAE